MNLKPLYDQTKRIETFIYVHCLVYIYQCIYVSRLAYLTFTDRGCRPDIENYRKISFNENINFMLETCEIPALVLIKSSKSTFVKNKYLPSFGALRLNGA